jgi:hypothetical protein
LPNPFLSKFVHNLCLGKKQPKKFGLHVAMISLKNLSPGGTWTRVFSSWVRCDVHCATPSGQMTKILRSGWTHDLPQGWNLSPRGNVQPYLHPRGEHSTLRYLEEWRGKQKTSSPVDNFTPAPGDKIHPWWTNSPLGSKFAPRGEAKNGPLRWFRRPSRLSIQTNSFMYKLLPTPSFIHVMVQIVQ